jgi:hypothetical protein
MVPMRRYLVSAVVGSVGILGLSGCTSFNLSNPFASSPPPEPTPVAIPPSLRGDDIVGRWGLASYHREQDRPRTEAAARGQCKQAYVINRSPGGGVMMLGHDNPQIQDMMIKGSAEGKTYIGPGPDPGGSDDREVVTFDGRVLILKWVDPEIAGRYGNMILVRCGPEGTAPRVARVKRPPPGPGPQ